MNAYRKLLLITLLTILFCPQLRAADLVDGTSYYIINDFYGKLLGLNQAGDGPALSVEGKNADADSYIFVAEKSSTSGYVYLRHKSTGKYLAASGSNNYSVTLEGTKSGDRFLWSVTTGLKTRITNKKNTGTRLGCDWNNTEYEGVYYDKGAGVMNFWSVIPVSGGSQHDYNNVRGTRERDYYTLDAQNITLDEAIDLHIYRENSPITTGTIDLQNERAWVIFDNCTPTNVKTNYLSKIRINGAKAVLDSNCRIAIYLNGAAVIPCKATEAALTGYTELNYGGEAINITNGNHKDLGTNKNTIRSFKLRRGYMATLATNKDGKGYTRVYVADHADLEVNDLPEALDLRISSIHIKKWQYTGKKGFGGSSNNAYKLRCGWSYNWDANSTSSIDVEYIPIRQHRGWPSMSNVNGKEASTATLSINEPEHSEQHQGCSCGGTIDEWTATTLTPDFLASGSRIGSPAPTDQGWLKNYFGHVNDMAYRCDFSVTHAYWGPNDANGTSGWNNRINSIYNDTKRPLWITEWEYGSSWYSDQSIYNKDIKEMAKKTLEILDALETNDHLERYAYYNTDGVWKLHCWYDDGYITPVGEAYRYVKSDFAYKKSQQAVPNYWTPATSAPSITDVMLADGVYSITVKNSNGDFTSTMSIQGMGEDGLWHDVFQVTDRSLYDNTTNTFKIEASETAYTSWRVSLTSLSGKQVNSETYTLYGSVDEMPNLAFDQDPFISTGIATYEKDKNTKMGLSGMQEVQGWQITENGDARAAGQYAWGSTCVIGGDGYTMPALNSDGDSQGGGIALVAVWTASASYTSNVMLKPGRYTISIPVYNIGAGTDIDSNLTGITLSAGGKHIASRKSYEKGKWTVEEFQFDITKAQAATLSLGYVAKNVGSGSSPHLVYDYVKIAHETTSTTSIATTEALPNITSTYTLSGQRIAHPSNLPKGIYIMGGKKVVK